MPSKLLVHLSESGSHHSKICLQQGDDPPVELRHVERISISQTSDGGPPMVELTMWTPDFDATVAISDRTAEAIVMHERRNLLAFLTTTERDAIKRSVRPQDFKDVVDSGASLFISNDVARALLRLTKELLRQESELEVF